MAGHDIEEESAPLMDRVEKWPVFNTIMAIRRDVCHYLDTALTYDQLLAPDLTYSLVRPLANKYAKVRNMAVPFCFLINRVHFLRDQNFNTRHVSLSRAALCELLAIRSLREWADTMDLATVLVTSFELFQGASPEILARAEDEKDENDLRERVGNAIEIAIISQAKRFIKCSPCQKIINAIWRGEIVYEASSAHAILSDTYKRRPIYFYDYRKAPLLDHYRLKVPAVRAVLEYMNFLILFVLFVVALEGNEVDRLNIYESAFALYALGFTLERVAAMQEHGLKMFSANLWNFFDLAFISIYLCYAGLRIHGLRHHSIWAMGLGIDFLAVGACLMFPRLAFATMSNNLMVLSLRSMLFEFAVLMLLAAFCFGGFLYALWTLGRGKFTSGQIAWWMLDIWFGLDASGFDRSSSFHPFFGPTLMVVYACLSNTLLLTVLVSILSNTFATINADALAESLFRHAVTTIEGVKSDALFSYLPPLNLIAFLVMFPASYILTPRWFHKLNVAAIRLTSFPILLAIAFYERQIAPSRRASTIFEQAAKAAEWMMDSVPRRLKRLSLFEGFAGPGSDIDAIFEIEEEVTAGGGHQNMPPRATHPEVSQANGAGSSSVPLSVHGRPTTTNNRAQGKSTSVDSTMRRRRHSEMPKGSRELMKELVSQTVQPAFTPLMRLFQPVVEEEGISSGDRGGPRRTGAPTNLSLHRKSATTDGLSWRQLVDDSARSMPDTATGGMRGGGDDDDREGSREPRAVHDVQDDEDGEQPALWKEEEVTNRLQRMELRQQRMEELLMQIAPLWVKILTFSLVIKSIGRDTGGYVQLMRPPATLDPEEESAGMCPTWMCSNQPTTT